MIKKFFPYKEKWQKESRPESICEDSFSQKGKKEMSFLSESDARGKIIRKEKLLGLMEQFDELVMQEIKTQKRQTYKAMVQNPRNRQYLFYLYWYCVFFIWIAFAGFVVFYVVAGDEEQFNSSINKDYYNSYRELLMLVLNFFSKITSPLCILMIQEKYMIGDKIH